MTKVFSIFAGILLAVSMSGCVPLLAGAAGGAIMNGAKAPAAEQVGASSQVWHGVVTNTHPETVTVDSNGVVKTLAGGAVGGLIGSTIGSGTGQLLATVGGALAGIGISNSIGRHEVDVNRLVIRLDTDEEISVLTAADNAFAVGQRVDVIRTGTSTQVIPGASNNGGK